MSRYTPTQQRILNMLADGEGHTKDELLTCLGDELASKPALAVHICRLRKLLPASHMIVAVRGKVGTPLMYYHFKRITHKGD